MKNKKVNENIRDEMRKLNDNRRAEIEEIGRGNITNTIHNNNQLDISRE